jgi:hypothetical protein
LFYGCFGNKSSRAINLEKEKIIGLLLFDFCFKIRLVKPNKYKKNLLNGPNNPRTKATNRTKTIGGIETQEQCPGKQRKYPDFHNANESPINKFSNKRNSCFPT